MSIKNTKNVLIKKFGRSARVGIGVLYPRAQAHLADDRAVDSSGRTPDSRGWSRHFTRRLEAKLDVAEARRSAFSPRTATGSTSTTIVSGAVAERFSLQAYALVAELMSGARVFRSPRTGCGPIRGGYRATSSANCVLKRSAFDFAGSGVVHVVGGCSALLSVIVVGPRRGRLHVPAEARNVFAAPESRSFNSSEGCSYREARVGSDSIAAA